MKNTVLLCAGIAALACAATEATAREARSGARTSVNQGAAQQAQGSRNANVNRSNTNVSSRNVSRETNVNRNTNINVDVDQGGFDHPWAAAAAVGTAAAVTSAAIGSMVYSVPPSCQTVVVSGVSYSQCGNTWYQPQMVGSAVQYVVVAPPQ
jgi:Flp pilus assembly protein TadB